MTNLAQPPIRPGAGRLVYGLNAAIIAIVAVALVAGIDWLTVTYKTRADWTIAASNSLSPKSRKLLQDVQAKKQKYELVNLFSHAPDDDGHDRYQQIQDLLENYARTSGNVTIGPRDDLEVRIRERYADELKPYEKAVADFTPLANDLEKFFKNQAAAFGAVSQQSGLTTDDKREVLAVQGAFNTGIPEAIKRARDTIRKKVDSTTPEYSTAVSTIKSLLEALSGQLDQVAKADAKEFSKPLAAYFKEHGPDYKAMADKVKVYQERVNKLDPLKVEDVLSSVSSNTVVVLGDKAVKVIDSYDIYKPSRNANPDDPKAPKTSFEGEQALTSAILALSNPAKPKVVYVTAAPAQMISGDYSELTDRLQKANFEVLEWAPAGPPSPGQPPSSENPPAEGKGVVWIVFPPDAPNQQQMMMGMPPPNPGPVIEAVQKHLAAGGSVMFLAEASGMMGMFSPDGGAYPYAGLIKSWGIEVKPKYTVVRNYVQGERSQVVPQILVSKFPSSKITDPLQSLPTMFAPLMTRMGPTAMPTVVDIAADKPADVEAQVIVRTDKSDNVWGESNYTPKATFDAKEDIGSPVPMAVAASKKSGQRVVVIGAKAFASNTVLQYAEEGTIRGGMVVPIYAFPGNAELALNSVYWLADYENMIAVGPQANVALRVRDMGKWEELTVRSGVFLLPPLLALATGIAVFVIRRR